MLTACYYTSCYVYSVRLLMMDKKPARNIQSSITKISYEKLVHFIRFIMGIFKSNIQQKISYSDISKTKSYLKPIFPLD
jgi:hypothetical protein